MSEKTYFLDTYAIFEIIRGNAGYEKYKNVPAITTLFNLAELNYGLKKETDRATADKITEKYAAIIADVTISDIKEAADLKTKNRLLSIPDAVGYTVAKRCNAIFLTGDKEFKKMPNVEFVEK